MSLFDDERYTWRETYFVLLEDFRRRPLLDDLCRELQRHGETLKILNGTANADGRLRVLTVASYEDHSALEITYRQGTKAVNEIDTLVRSLEKGGTAKERERLRSIRHRSAKLDVLHFEQTAGTAEFQVVKLPVLKFLQSSGPANRGNKIDRPQKDAPKAGPMAKRQQFRFDPNSYENCLAGGTGDEYARQIDQFEAEAYDSGIFDRVDPDTLVSVLETLCRITGGIAIDPASGVIIDNGQLTVDN